MSWLFFFFFTERTCSGATKYCYCSSVTQTLEHAFKRQSAYAPASKNTQDLTAAISYCIAKDMMPSQMVDRPGFSEGDEGCRASLQSAFTQLFFKD